MSVRRLAAEQPSSFELTAENRNWADAQVKKYPPERKASAVIPLLWRAQEQNDGWLSEPALRCVAEFLGMPYIRVYEVATFYTMFNLSPVGKHYVQLCGTTPCWLRGADELKAVCRKVIGEQGQVTEDGMFSWLEVECLGACVNAPMVQINKDYYEDLTAESFEKILMDLRAGQTVKPGPQVNRHSSDPEGGPLTLVDPDLYRAKAPEPAPVRPAPAPPPRPHRSRRRAKGATAAPHHLRPLPTAAASAAKEPRPPRRRNRREPASRRPRRRLRATAKARNRADCRNRAAVSPTISRRFPALGPRSKAFSTISACSTSIRSLRGHPTMSRGSTATCGSRGGSAARTGSSRPGPWAEAAPPTLPNVMKTIPETRDAG